MARWGTHLNADTNLREVQAAIKDAVIVFHPGVDFTDIWIEPRTSWSGSDMIEVWAIYDGDTGDLAAPAKPSLRTRIQDILWDMGLDAFPSVHLVAKADARDLTPGQHARECGATPAFLPAARESA